MAKNAIEHLILLGLRLGYEGLGLGMRNRVRVRVRVRVGLSSGLKLG